MPSVEVGVGYPTLVADRVNREAGTANVLPGITELATPDRAMTPIPVEMESAGAAHGPATQSAWLFG